MKVNQVDDLLGPELLAAVQSRFDDPMINWGTFPPEFCKDQRMYDWYQMTHLIWEVDDDLSPLSDLASVILAQALDKTGRKLQKMFRARLINSFPGELGRTLPHIDLPGPHNTGIFFPFDSSGDTLVYQQRSMLEHWDRPEEVVLAEQLAPTANTWYDFDGTHWRVSGRPVDHDRRICLVINFIATSPQPLE